MSDNFRLVAHIHPFSPADRIIKEIEAGITVQDLLYDLDIKYGVPKIWVNGKNINANYEHIQLEKNDHVLIKVLPAGDNSRDVNTNTAKAAGWTIAAGIGLMFINPIAGMGVIGVGIFTGVVGSAVAQTMKLQEMGALSNKEDSGRLLSLRGGRNQSAYGKKMPVILGRHLVTPLYAARPLTSISGENGVNQNLTLLFLVGYGPLRCTQFKIGETLLSANSANVRNGAITDISSSFSGVELQVYDDGTIPPLYNRKNIEEQYSILLEYSLDSEIRTTEKNTTQATIQIVFPQGLVQYDDNNKAQTRTVEIAASYRLTGSTGAGTRFATINVSASSRRPVRYEASTPVLASGQYDILVSRLTPNATDDTKIIDKFYWTVLRSSNADIPVVRTPIRSSDLRARPCLVALRIQASDQLNGVIDQFNCVAESLVPVYSGSGSGASSWSEGYTQNPAALYLWLLRGPMNPRPLPNNLIDWPSFERWYNLCTANNWTCNAVLANGTRLEDLLSLVASTGRASRVSRDGLESIAIDEPKTIIVQHFTPRNTRNFTWSKTFPDLPHALKISFINAAEGWAPDERIVPDDGYTADNAQKLEKIELWGITDPALIYREGRYLIAKSKLRPEIFTFEASVDAVICEVGDLILVQHDAPLWGVRSARIKDVIVVSGNVTQVRLDDSVPMEAGNNYSLRWRRSDGSSVVASVNTTPGEYETLTFTTPQALNIEAGNLAIFGRTGLETARLVVSGIETLDQFTYKIYAVEEAPAVHTNPATIPDHNSLVTRPAANAIINKVIPQPVEQQPIPGAPGPQGLPGTVYHGMYLYPSTPFSPNEGDLYLAYSEEANTDDHPNRRGVIERVGSSWTRTIDAEKVRFALRDILDITSVIIDPTANPQVPRYGVAADYEVDLTASAAIFQAAFIKHLTGGNADFSGHVRAKTLTAEESITSPWIETTAPRNALAINRTIPATWWNTTAFVNEFGPLHFTGVTGNYNGTQLERIGYYELLDLLCPMYTQQTYNISYIGFLKSVFIIVHIECAGPSSAHVRVNIEINGTVYSYEDSFSASNQNIRYGPFNVSIGSNTVNVMTQNISTTIITNQYWAIFETNRPNNVLLFGVGPFNLLAVIGQGEYTNKQLTITAGTHSFASTAAAPKYVRHSEIFNHYQNNSYLWQLIDTLYPRPASGTFTGQAVTSTERISSSSFRIGPVTIRNDNTLIQGDQSIAITLNAELSRMNLKAPMARVNPNDDNEAYSPIVRSWSNSLGTCIQFYDGTMIQRGDFMATTTNRIFNIFPAPFIGIDTDRFCSMSMGVTPYAVSQHYCNVWSHGGVGFQIEVINGNHYAWIAIGRWKA